MSARSFFLYDILEWDFFAKRWEPIPPLRPRAAWGLSGVELFEVTRDRHYRLIGRMVLRPTREEVRAHFARRREGPPEGTFVDPERIEMENDTFKSVVSCYPASHNTTHTALGVSQVEIGLSVSSIEETDGEPDPDGWSTDWYLNGPGDHVWRSWTDRKSRQEYTRSRAGNPPIERHFATPNLEGGGFDTLRFSLPSGVQVVVHGVDEKLSRRYRGVGIQFEDGRAPVSEDTRRAVGELVGFVFGRRLVHVGSTRSAATGFAQWRLGLNPWGDNLASLKKRPDYAPVPIETNRGETVDAEDLLERRTG